MDILDNTIFTALVNTNGRLPITSDVVPFDITNYIAGGGFANPNVAPYNYTNADKCFYTALPDHDFIERAITKHWHDINDRLVYQVINSSGTRVDVSDFSPGSPYHLIFSYTVENTRILQIFERIIQKFLLDEELGITSNSTSGAQAFQWLLNSEALFFKESSIRRAGNVRSFLRSDYEANRRNAYHRMFGLDLAFGSINDGTLTNKDFFKSKYSNQSFIVVFEQLLIEIWQGYINARNTSGANSTDLQNIVNIATNLQDMLNARRGGNTKPYQFQTLSKEEYYSVLITTWFMYVITFNSPIIEWLGCQANTIGDRLTMIGQKAGIPAHKKSQLLFEMAGPIATLLRSVEQGIYNSSSYVNRILTSLNPLALGTPADQAVMNDLLTIINHWEQTTGHRIKSPETTVRGTVSITQPQRTNGRLVPTN